jgi:short-subunit dehydrogenase involved in D-alanine esterification of teichoic acids
VIGGGAGIGLEVARRARAEGANIILTGRDPERLQPAASEIGALSSAAFDANRSRLPAVMLRLARRAAIAMRLASRAARRRAQREIAA